ncbi:hypothetical protein CC1G_14260 [Coprinopsis cinerea okayama7|uniref:Protein CPL1-like domain-containing protein n=1 Tax=Coprinopsis cinerea (strain Okayama-7 / 130 / ATCC MYA-4618 / FGSC 9003) TaxID=240176 RepID=D6RLF1_COPC7|nr:hypothetical protein CC1G_14260 [Coprinopsis cinerea okayama7\|eukprot:XP_002911729.1 hypothetical protein CC1G_14260 [Coprinopsis cinerea okayama7\
MELENVETSGAHRGLLERGRRRYQAGRLRLEHGQRTCIRARPGYHCPGAGMKQEQHCTPGTYSSASGSTDCDPCPPGAMCPHNAVHSPQLCSPGRYSTGGWVNCETCNPGTFNNIHGAVTCCPCPAGCFATSSGNTNCQRCPNQKPYSNPGSPSHGHCSSMKGSYAPESDCQKGGNGFCSPGTPFLGGSGLPRRQLSFKDACEPGYQPCPNYRGTTSIGIDCVDILNDLESCGGCVDYSLDGAADGGRDCTAIPFADRTLVLGA